MKIGEALKRFRERFKFSQREMSTKMKVSRPMYQAYEYGKSIPGVDVLINLANDCDVSLDYLSGLIDEPRPLKSENSYIEKSTISDEYVSRAEMTELKSALAAQGIKI